MTVVAATFCGGLRTSRSAAWQAVAVHLMFVPEVADYELRRELLRLGSTRGLQHLDEAARTMHYQPATTTHWRRAAELWAERRRGQPKAHHQALD